MLLPGAILDPGAHWNYEAGYTSCIMDVWHYTVGRDSRALIKNNGLAAFLVRDEGIYQYAPSNARCFTQCEWNAVATATEVESLDGSISDAQLRHLQYLTLWKMTTHGIPDVFYNGPRMPVLNGYRGVTNHRNLVHRACDMHSDGFDEWVWVYVNGPSAPQRKKEGMQSFLCQEMYSNTLWVVNPDTNTKTFIETWEQFLAQVQLRNIINYVGGTADPNLHKTNELVDGKPLWGDLWSQARNVDEFNDVGTGGGGGGTGGATPDQVREIVTADGNLTRGEVRKPRPLSGQVG